MKMLQHSSSAPNAARFSLSLIALLAVTAGTAFGGEHTDFPDLSIKPGERPRPPALPAHGFIDPRHYDIVDFVDGEAHNNPSGIRFPVPPLPPVINPPAYNPEAPIGGTFGAVPTPGAGGLMLIGLALIGRRQRR